MKPFALLILAALFAAPNTWPANDPADVGSGPLAKHLEAIQFRPEEVVVKIGKHYFDAKESLKRGGLSILSNNGTGYCFGQGKCDFILTNYHVAERVGSPLKVNGEKVLQTYEATSPQDEGAIWEKSPLGFNVKLVPVRDIAIFRIAHPLKEMHGTPFSSRELRDGEKVRIYGYPGGGKLTELSASFYATAGDGMLLFKVRPEDQKFLVPGVSGSLVVNSQNEAVGLVQAIANGNLAIAVPAWSIVDFVKKVQPDTYQDLFPPASQPFRPNNLEPGPVDLIAESAALSKDLDPESGVSPPPILPEEYLWMGLDQPIPSLAPANVGDHVRKEEPTNVQALRKNAENMVDRINDLIAVGTQRSVGGNLPEVTAQYKLRMVDGQQTFTIKENELHQLPCPKGNGFGLGAAWANFPTMVGSNLKLRIEQVDDRNLPEWGDVKVFRYEGTTEDKVAKIHYCDNYGFGIHTEKTIAVPVRGEVWTDSSLNILRITQELLAPASMGWEGMRTSVLYGWFHSSNGERELVPTNIFSRADLADDHHTYSTICRITDYHQFSVSVAVGPKEIPGSPTATDIDGK